MERDSAVQSWADGGETEGKEQLSKSKTLHTIIED